MIYVEYALLIFGVYVLVAGKLPSRKTATRVVRGWRARLVGAIGMLPLPLTFAAVKAARVLFPALGRRGNEDFLFWLVGAVEGSAIVLCIATMVVLALVLRKPVEAGPGNVRGA